MFVSFVTQESVQVAQNASDKTCFMEVAQHQM